MANTTYHETEYTNRTDYPTKFNFQLDSWIKRTVMEDEMMNSIEKDFK